MAVGNPLYCTDLYGCNGGRNVDLLTFKRKEDPWDPSVTRYFSPMCNISKFMEVRHKFQSLLENGISAQSVDNHQSPSKLSPASSSNLISSYLGPAAPKTFVTGFATLLILLRLALNVADGVRKGVMVEFSIHNVLAALFGRLGVVFSNCADGPLFLGIALARNGRRRVDERRESNEGGDVDYFHDDLVDDKLAQEVAR